MTRLAEAFTVQVVGAQELKAALDGRKARVRAVFRKALAESSEAVLAVASRKVSGDVLNVDTGTLRRRLTYRVDSSAAFSRVGSPTIYAPRHEFGYSGAEHVSGHFRRVTQVFGRSVRGLVAYVAPFVRQAFTPERPFLRPALAESRPTITAVFRRHLAESIAGRAS